MTEKSDSSEVVPENILSFEEFKQPYPGMPIPRFDNFPLHFDSSDPDSTYRGQEYFKRFMAEYPILEKKLTQIFTEVRMAKSSKKEACNANIRELYEAYSILRSYGVSDEELFN